MRLFLGVDGGQTATRAVVGDEHGLIGARPAKLRWIRWQLTRSVAPLMVFRHYESSRCWNNRPSSWTADLR